MDFRKYFVCFLRKTVVLSAILPVCGIFAQTPKGTDCGPYKSGAQEYIEKYMNVEPLRSGLVGVLAVKMSGDTIAECNSLRKLLPASNVKLITTGLAIRGLGSDYKFDTAVGYSGHVNGGVLHGDLYILGGGDPTIASGDPGTMQIDTLFACWKGMLDKAGINRINGNVIGDGRYFDGPIEQDSWSYCDLGTYYGAGCNGLSFNRNILNIKVSAGSKPGMPVNAAVDYPILPWMEFRKNCVTAPAGTGDNLYLFNTDLAPVAELRGSFALDKTAKTEECSYKFGALACATYFIDYLRCAGIAVAGEAADVDAFGKIRTAGSLSRGELRSQSRKDAVQVDAMHIIGDTESIPLGRIARITNSRSDNFYAETLLRNLARERTGSASYDSCRVVIARELDSLDVDCSYGIRMVDGSGLARHNYISPDFFCRFLGAMAKSGSFWPYLATISRPGEPGMRSCLAGKPAEMKSRIRMKSGSMNGVLCYSGYVMPESGKKDDVIVFSIMTNNCEGPVSSVRTILSELISRIAMEN